jgi:ribosomal protein L11 methyltransferase
LKKKSKRTSSWWTGGLTRVDVGQKLRLVPYWERAYTEDDRVNIIVDPGPAFGAGDHPSTIMALELLESAIERFHCTGPRLTVMDAGTGTGVLAIAAKLLGSGFTVGFDIDSASIYSARRNVQLNGFEVSSSNINESLELYVGGVEAVLGTFDIVLANLAAPTLIRLSGQLVKVTGRYLILSGIADAMQEAVLRTYAELGLKRIDMLNRNEWNSVWFQAG